MGARLPSRARLWADEPMKRVALRARVARPWWRLRFAAFGRGSILHRPDWVYGPRHIAIGNDVVILSNIWLSAERRTWDREEPAITIGDGVGIRPYCSITAAERVEIEDNVVLSAFTSVIDSDHTWDGPAENIAWNPVVTAPIRIGRGTWVGERVSILRGAQIGRFCIIGANSVVRGEIPDFSVAAGVPARVVGSTRDQVQHLLGPDE